MGARPLIIDCDPGQDDAIALLMAIASPEDFALLGVTAVAGNVPLAKTEANARRVRDLAGRPELPVYAGCRRPMVRAPVTAEAVHGPSGIDGADLPEPRGPTEETHAVDFLVQTLGQASRPVTLATLGPLTNVAIAIIKNPSILDNVAEIVAMGGAIGLGNVTPAAEFNIYADPHAAHVVFEAGVPLTMVGLDVTRQAIAMPACIDAIRSLGTVPALAVCGMLEYYGARTTATYRHGPPLHDPCVIAYLLKPELFQGRDMRVAVELVGEHALGRTVCDVHGRSGAPNARVLEHVDAEGFFDLLTERLARLPVTTP